MMHFYWSRDNLIIVAFETVRSSREVAQTIFQYEEIIVKIERLLHLMWVDASSCVGKWELLKFNGSEWTRAHDPPTMGCKSHLVM